MEQPEGIALPVVYTSVDDAPIVYANQFAIQFNEDEFFLTVGQLQPPLLLGTPEEQKEQASRLTHVPVRVLLRVGLTRGRMAALAQLLADHLRRYDEQKGTDR